MAFRATSDQTKPGGAARKEKTLKSPGFATSNQSLANSSLRSYDKPSRNALATSQGDSFASQQELDKYISSKFENMKKTQIALTRAAILGGFVPDYVVEDNRLEMPYLHKFQGVVFVTDVAGFTALTEAYSLNGKGGTEQLTKTLANYMGPLAECILRTGGDIIKFAGDAFLSVWRVKEKNPAEDIPELLQKVIDCALYCQEKYGSYVTDVQITIKVKIGIGAGTCYHVGLGNNYYQHYVAFGPGVYAASSAEHHCASGDVILHESAWQYLDPTHFTFTAMSDGYVKVTDILHFINPSIRGRPIVAQRLNLNNSKKDKENKRSSYQAHKNTDIVRPLLEQVLEATAEERLRKYMIPPVLKKLDDDLPLDYLNESRMVSIVFLHVSHAPFELNSSFGTNMAAIVQAGFLTIYKSVTGLNGCLTKVIMFDKGLTYLVVFGLPGYIQDNQTANSLHFARRMVPALKSIPNVTEVSIGCTTGSTYCGILGHPRRHEYTVIGKQVNKAARLMCYYPGKVTCSQDTFYSSKLPSSYFQQLESKVLKGISNVGKIYEYLGAEMGSACSLIKQYEYPLLGRKTERELVLNNLRAARREFDQTLAAAQMSVTEVDNRNPSHVFSSCAWMMVIEGENGIGKTRFLSTCMNDAKKLNWKLFSVVLSIQHAALNLYPIESLLMQSLGMEGLRSSKEREEHVRRILAISDPELISGISVLNEVLHMKLPSQGKFIFADTAARHGYAQHMIVQLLKQMFPKTMVLFVVEDAHYMSQNSWEYLNYISRLPSIRTLMTLRRNPDGLPRIPDVAYKICYHSPHVTTVRLSGLVNKYILPLACQILEVRAIPTELEKIIITKSQGNPTWVEDVLNELLAQDKMKIVDFPKGTKLPKDTKLSIVDDVYIRKQVVPLNSRPKLISTNSTSFFLEPDPFKSNEDSTKPRSVKIVGEPGQRICLLKSNTNLNTASISGSLKEKLLDLFDSLNSNEQLLIKCACVLGPKFSHSMLNRLLPLYGRDAKKHLSSFRNLMEEKIFVCASRPNNDRRASLGTTIKNRPVRCFCSQGERVSDVFTDDYEVDVTKLNLPLYCYCRYVELARPNMVEVVYELLTEDLKKELHLKAAKYLETIAIQCYSCGGPQTTYLYGFALKENSEEEDDAVSAAGIRQRSLERERVSADTGRRSLHTSLQIKMQFSAVDADSKRLGGTPDDMTSHGTVEPEEEAARATFGRNQGNVTSRLKQVRNMLQNSGGQLAAVELEILNTIMNEQSSKRCSCSCRRREAAVQATPAADDKPGISSQTQTDKITSPASTPSQNKKISLGSEFTAGSSELTSTTRSPTRSVGSLDSLLGEDFKDVDVTIEEFDLRGCQCTAIQVQVCTDLVKHYRKAADSSLTMENVNQAQNYIDEASALLEDFINGKVAAVEDMDDQVIIERDISRRITFLQGLLYYLMGTYPKSKTTLLQAVRMMSVPLPDERSARKIRVATMFAGQKLWKIYHGCRCVKKQDKHKKGNKMAAIATMKIRALSCLQKMYLIDGNIGMVVLAAMLQVILSEKLGGVIEDVIPAYYNMMKIYTRMGNHKKAVYYEERAIQVIRNQWFDTTVDALALLTIGNFYLVLSTDRLLRGEFKSASDAAFLSLQIATIVHDTTLQIHCFPTLIRSLMNRLEISEIVEAFHNLWYLSKSEAHWTGTALYFSLVMDMILELCCPIESFYYCEQFVTGKDWKEDIALFKLFEIQFSFEASLAIWYARFSKWEEAVLWRTQAELHKPAAVNTMSVAGNLKLLECYLISANFHQQKKRYQLFASDRKMAKELIRDLSKWVKILPVFQPRFHHILAYYSKIRERKRETEYHLKEANKIAKQHGNLLEQEYIKHSRLVWSSAANPTVRHFWLEHQDKNTIDYRSGAPIPWANVMYSLPVPTWS